MSIIKNVTLQTIVAHDFRYDPRSRGGSRGLSSQVSSAAHTINGTILFLHIFCCAKFPADELAGEELICHQNRKSENPQSDKTGTMS